jgi:hypothetical protein
MLRSLISAILFASTAFAQGTPQVSMEPPHTAGQAVTAAFEGWYPDPKGAGNVILIGYYNRNQKEALDIPIGPNNRIDPGGPDRGQPTHFAPGRQWGVFSITVPKDFGPDNKLTWTIVSNGKTTAVPFSLNSLWVISPFIDATKNTPPFIGFDESGPFLQGPPRGISKSLTTAIQDPLPLTVWVADDANVPPMLQAFVKSIPAVMVSWSKFGGPGDVKFASEKPKVEKFEFKAPPNTAYTGKAATTATFSQPGDYVLEITANDLSGPGGGGFQCCWSSAQVKVTVKPGATAER